MSETKEEVKKEEFGDQFDFNNMFRVKGKKGLFYPISQVNKAGMLCVTGLFNSGGKHITKASNLICLGHLGFTKLDQSVIGMNKVFTNLSNYCINSEDYGFEKITLEELMPIMVPDYDENEFKIHHAKQVLGWYIEVTLKYSDLIDDKVEKGEVELLTEDKKD